MGVLHNFRPGPSRQFLVAGWPAQVKETLGLRLRHQLQVHRRNGKPWLKIGEPNVTAAHHHAAPEQILPHNFLYVMAMHDDNILGLVSQEKPLWNGGVGGWVFFYAIVWFFLNLYSYTPFLKPAPRFGSCLEWSPGPGVGENSVKSSCPLTMGWHFKHIFHTTISSFVLTTFLLWKIV